MLILLARSLEFGFYHCLLSAVDRVSQLPRNTTMPEASRLYRENIALKAQLETRARPADRRAHRHAEARERRVGAERIAEELRRMGIRVNARTIQKVLDDNGFTPHPGGRKMDFERFQSAAKDAVWAVDYFAVGTAKNTWLQVLMILDIHTRERIDLRVYDGWDVDSWWTSRAFNDALARSKRKLAKVIHDHGSHFAGQLERQLRVLEIEQDRTVTGLPSLNCYVETSIGTCRRELLRHIRCADAAELQCYLDEYRVYVNEERAHQSLDGRAPAEYSSAVPEAELIPLDELAQRRLVRREYAGGMLHEYSLVDGPPDPPVPIAA